MNTGDDCFATAEAVHQGILPKETKLHFVRRNSRNPSLVRVTWGRKSAQVHESFLTLVKEHAPKEIATPVLRGALTNHEFIEHADTLGADCKCGQWSSTDEGLSKWYQWIEHFIFSL